MIPIQVRAIDHVVLRIVDEQSMLHFYGNILGCPVERRQDALGLIQLRAGRALIDLVTLTGKLGREGGAAPGPEGRNMDHFCLRVDPFNETEIRAHLAAHGVCAIDWLLLAIGLYHRFIWDKSKQICYPSIYA